MKVKRKYVMVDLGYGLPDYSTRVKVIAERQVNTLFSGEETDLLVEVRGGERVWVSSWAEVPPKTKEKQNT